MDLQKTRCLLLQFLILQFKFESAHKLCDFWNKSDESFPEKNIEILVCRVNRAELSEFFEKGSSINHVDSWGGGG